MSVECQQEHRREPSGGSDNVVCSEEEEGETVRPPSNAETKKNFREDENNYENFDNKDNFENYSSSASSTTRPSPPVIRGNQIRIEAVPDLLK